MLRKFVLILSAIISGLVLWAGFDLNWAWPLMLVGLLPLLHYIYAHAKNGWSAFWVATLVGTVYMGGVMSWHWHTLPLDWAGIDSPTFSFGLMVYVWGLPSFASGIFFGLWALVLFKLKQNSWFDIILSPAIWIIFEFIRGFAISILWSGNGGLIGPHWTIGFLGYALATPHWVLIFSQIGGLPLLSFIVVLFNMLFYSVVLNAWSKDSGLRLALIRLGSVAGVVILISMIAIILKPSGEALSVAVTNSYQPSFSRLTVDEFNQNFSKKRALLESIDLSKNFQAVILPEDSRLLWDLVITENQSFLNDLFGEREVLIVDSARQPDETGAVKLQFSFYNTKSKQVVYSDKQFLVPHGEYLPDLTKTLANFSPSNDWLDGFFAQRQFAKGHTPTIVDINGVGIGASACSEIMSADINRDLVNLDANILVNAASHSLFNGVPRLYRQTRQMAAIRATENNRSLIHSGNFIPSFIVDSHGKIIAESGWHKDTIIYSDVPVETGSSLYNLFGRWLMAALAVGIVLTRIWLVLKSVRTEETTA